MGELTMVSGLALVTTIVGCGLLLCISECVHQGNGQQPQAQSVSTPPVLVHVVGGTAPPALDVSSCVSNVVSVSSRWATDVLKRELTSVPQELSAYGRKLSFRKDTIGRDVVDVEFFRVDKYPDWRAPRPWIMGGFPFYFRVTIDIADMFIVKGYTDSM